MRYEQEAYGHVPEGCTCEDGFEGACNFCSILFNGVPCDIAGCSNTAQPNERYCMECLQDAPHCVSEDCTEPVADYGDRCAECMQDYMESKQEAYEEYRGMQRAGMFDERPFWIDR